MVEQVARARRSASRKASVAVLLALSLAAGTVIAGERRGTMRVMVRVVDPCLIVAEGGTVQQSGGCGPSTLGTSGSSATTSPTGPPGTSTSASTGSASVATTADAGVVFLDVTY